MAERVIDVTDVDEMAREAIRQRIERDGWLMDVETLSNECLDELVAASSRRQTADR